MGQQYRAKGRKEEGLWGLDLLTDALRERIGEMIITIVNEEVAEVVGAVRYGRTGGRRGYRHGTKERQLTTGVGVTEIRMPRARLVCPDGQEEEWHSRFVRRYQRRCVSVDAALLGAYLSGANSRRIKGALSPLLRGSPLSRSTISRIVGRLQELFTRWRKRSLAETSVRVLYLDAIALRVRIANKVVSAPVLVALGVSAQGQKVVLDLELLTSESTVAWEGFVQGLGDRGLQRPSLCVIDGSKALRAAVEATWPGMAVQRCCVHKLRNLERYVPRHALEQMRAEYHRITEADCLESARQAYQGFIVKWKKVVPKAAQSLEEAGEELLTVYRFPKALWKVLRTTNAIERLHEEFRRRVKTQGSLPDAQSAELLFFGLLMSGQVLLRRVRGWRHLSQVPEVGVQKAA